MSAPLWILLIAAVVMVALWLAPVGFTEPPQIEGRTSYVVDGDSLYLDGYKPQVRLWGVDAPEKGERGFQAASETLSRFAQGQRLTCRVIEPDRYGRSVARCFLPDGREINRLMIESGTAREYHYFSKGFYSNQSAYSRS